MTKFFITPDPYTALGLLRVDKNIKLVCADHNDVVDCLETRGFEVFCLEREGIKHVMRNSKVILTQSKVKEYINGFSGAKAFLFFKTPLLSPSLLKDYNNPLVLGVDGNLVSRLENKIYFNALAKSAGIPIVKHIESEKNAKGFPVVLQKSAGWAGSGTKLIESKEELTRETHGLEPGTFKIVEYVPNAETYTNNAVITDNRVFVSPSFLQYTGLTDFSAHKLASCGNNFFKGLSNDLEERVCAYTKSLGKILNSKHNFKGFFGLDFLIKDNDVFFVELNPRFTASAVFTTQLEHMFGTVSLQELHVSAFGEGYNNRSYKQTAYKGKRFVVRNTDNKPVTIANERPSGVYKINAGNFEYVGKGIFADELKEDEALLFIKPQNAIVDPDIDLINFQTMSEIKDDIIVKNLKEIKSNLLKS